MNEIQSIIILNYGTTTKEFRVEDYCKGGVVTKITQERNDLFRIYLDNGDFVEVITNSVMVHWKGE